ncbi:MAG: hypothetical protein M3495_11475 [Pseudomonadota bacterium]|nr:hypothetical protein [Pseudomonadota bacterium]
MRLLLTLIALALTTPSASTAQRDLPRDQPLPDCEWCGAADAPPSLTWEATLADPAQPGERLVVSGTVYQPDGRTPAAATATCGDSCGRTPRAATGSTRSNRAATPAGPRRPTST